MEQFVIKNKGLSLQQFRKMKEKHGAISPIFNKTRMDGIAILQFILSISTMFYWATVPEVNHAIYQ